MLQRADVEAIAGGTQLEQDMDIDSGQEDADTAEMAGASNTADSKRYA